MNEVLKTVLSLSLSGALLTLLLLLCKVLLGKRFAKGWHYYIWLVVIARLLLPFSPPISLVGTAFQRAEQGIAWVENAYYFGTDKADSLQKEAEGDTPSEDAAPGNGEFSFPSQGPLSPVLHGLGILWIMVALMLLIRKITIYQGFVRYVKAGRKAVSDPVLLDRLALLGERARVKRPVELYTNSLISSPLLLGLVRPCIVLPSDELSETDFTNTLLHELTHCRRWDMLLKWLAQLAVCLHWFNPLVYFMNREFNRACELSCDEAVIRKLDKAGRRAYGNTLLNAMGGEDGFGEPLASVTLCEGGRLLKERLGAIMSYQKKSGLLVVTSVALSAMLICGAVVLGSHLGKTGGLSLGSKTSGSAPMSSVPTDTVRTAGLALLERPNVDIKIEDGAAVDLILTEDDEITAEYGRGLYQVEITDQAEGVAIRIAYIGKASKYPSAVLRIPEQGYGAVTMQAEDATISYDRVFQNGQTIEASLNESSVFYTVPSGFTGTLNADVTDCYLELRSDDGYQNCQVSIENADTYGTIRDGFFKQGSAMVYENGTKAGSIRFDFNNGGYVSIE